MLTALSAAPVGVGGVQVAGLKHARPETAADRGPGLALSIICKHTVALGGTEQHVLGLVFPDGPDGALQTGREPLAEGCPDCLADFAKVVANSEPDGRSDIAEVIEKDRQIMSANPLRSRWTSTGVGAVGCCTASNRLAKPFMTALRSTGLADNGARQSPTEESPNFVFPTAGRGARRCI